MKKLKKSLIALVIINVIGVSLGAYTFSMSKNASKGPIKQGDFNLENITEVVTPPKEGNPGDYGILENIQYASGYLYNNRNWKASTKGDVISKAGVNVTQQVRNTRIVNKDYMYQEAISYSNMVKVAAQKFYNKDKVFILQGSPKGIEEVKWSDKVSPVTREYIYLNYGFMPDQLNSYYYCEESLEDTSTMEKVDGNYVLHVDLNDLGAINSRREIITLGGALDNPVYHYIHVDITIDSSWKVLNLVSSESYTIKKNIGIGVVDATCDSVLTEEFEYGKEIDQGIVSFYSKYFDAEIGNGVINEDNKTPLTYLQEMSSVLTNKNSFDIDLAYNDRKFKGQVQLNLLNKNEVNINIEDKYFIRYYNGNAYASIDGMNFSVDEEFINNVINNLIAKFGSTSLDTSSFEETEIDFNYEDFINQIMENMELEEEDGIAKVIIKASTQGLDLDAYLCFDEEDLNLLSMNGTVTYNGTVVTLGVDAKSDYQGEDIKDKEFNDISSTKVLVDRLFNLMDYGSYQIQGHYIYNSIDFEIDLITSLNNDISLNLSFSKENEEKKKSICLIKKSDVYYLNYGNLKISANESNLASIINELLEIINDEDIDVNSLLEGINFANGISTSLESNQEGELFINLEQENNTYKVAVSPYLEEGVELNCESLDLNLFVTKNTSDIISPETSTYLNEEDLNVIYRIYQRINSSIEEKNYSLAGTIDASNTISDISLQVDDDKTLIICNSQGELNFNIEVYIEGSSCYCRCIYDFVELSFVFNKDQVNSLSETIISTISEYYGIDFENEIREYINGIFSKEDITIESIVTLLLENSFEEIVSIDVKDSVVSINYDKYSLTLSDSEKINIVLACDENTCSFDFFKEEFTFVLDQNIYYTPIENIHYASFILDAYLELKDYKGYLLSGNVKYEGIDFDLICQLDQNGNNQYLLFVKTDEGEKEIKITKIGKNYYLEHGSIKVYSSEESLKDYLNQLINIFASEEQEIDTDSIITIIKNIDLVVESISFSENSFITTILLDGKYYPISLNYNENEKLSLNCTSTLLSFSLEVKEKTDVIEAIDETNYLSNEQFEEVYNYIKNIYNQISSSSFKTNFTYSYLDEYQVVGTASRNAEEYKIVSSLKVEDRIIPISILVKDKVYIDINYKEIVTSFTLEKDDVYNLVEDLILFINETYSENITTPEIDTSKDSIVSMIKDIVKSDYDKLLSIDISEDLLLTYEKYSLCIGDNKLSYKDNNNTLILSLVENDDTYLVDETKVYCSVTGVSSLIDLVKSSKEIVNYLGYQIDLSLDYEGIEVESQILFDQNKNAYVDLSFKFEGKEENIIIYYYDEDIIVKLDNVNFFFDREDIISIYQTLSKYLCISSSQIDEQYVLDTLSQIDLFIKNIQLDSSSILSIFDVKGQEYQLNVQYANANLHVEVSNFYSLQIDLKEYKEQISIPVVDESYLTLDDFNRIVDMSKRIYDDYTNNHLNGLIDVTINEVRISGEVIYLGLENIYGKLNVNYQEETIEVEISKIGNLVYLEVRYENYQVGIKYQVENDETLLVDSLKNSFKVIDERYNLGIYEKVFSDEKVETNIDVIKLVKDIILRQYLSCIDVEKITNGYVFSYENYQVSYEEDSSNIKVNFIYEDYSVNLVISSNYVISKVINEDDYVLVDVTSDFTWITNMVFDVLDYEGYLVEGSLVYEGINIDFNATINKNLNVVLAMKVSYEENSYDLVIKYVDSKVYVNFENLEIYLNEEDLDEVIKSISNLISKDQSSEVNESIVKVSEYVKSITIASDLSLVFNVSEEVYNVNLTYNEGLTLTVTDLYELVLHISESKEVIESIVVDESYLTLDDFNRIVDMSKRIYDDYTNNHLNGLIDVTINEVRISGEVIYLGLENIYGKLNVNYQEETIEVEISKIGNLVYLEVRYENYQVGIKYQVENDETLLVDSLKNSFKVIDERYNLGIYEKVFSDEKVETNIDVIKLVKDIILRQYLSCIDVEKITNGYVFSYENYQVSYEEDSSNIKVNFIYEDYSVNLVISSNYVISKVINEDDYVLVDVTSDFTWITNMVFDVLDYEGYLVELDFVIEDMIFNSTIKVDSIKNVTVDLNIEYQGINHLIILTYLDNVIYFEYGNILAKLSVDDIDLLIEDIKVLIDYTPSQSEGNNTVSDAIYYLSDYISAMTSNNNSLLVNFIFDNSNYSFEVSPTELGYSLSSDFYQANGILQEYTNLVQVNNSLDYLVYDDFKKIIEYCQEAKDYFYLDQGYLDLSMKFSSSDISYYIDAIAKYDYTDKNNAKLTVTLTVDEEKLVSAVLTRSQLFTGTISYQNNFVYLHNVMYNQLIGLNIYVEKSDAARAIDVILTKLAQGPFNNGDYGLNLEVMKAIKNILELDPSVILSFDDSNAFDETNINSFDQFVSTLKSILGLRLNDKLLLDVQDDNIICKFDKYFDGTISHYVNENNKKFIQIDGLGTIDENSSYECSLHFNDYVDFTISTDNCIYLSDLEILANGAMNTINACKYDVSGTINLNVIGLVKLGMKVDRLLLELDENGTPSGYIKLTTDTNSLITEGKSALGSLSKSEGGVRGDYITSYIYLSKDGTVLCRREYESWKVTGTNWIGSKKYGNAMMYETLSYTSQEEFVNDFLNAFVWLTKFDKSFIDRFAGSSIKATKKDNAINSYSVSEDKLNYTLGVNLGCVASIFDDGSTLKFGLINDNGEYYLKTLGVNVSIYKVVSADGAFTLNSYGVDLDYSSMPSVEMMKYSSLDLV